MKILHYVPGLPPVSAGGLTKYAPDLADAQSRLGHRVEILLPWDDTCLNHAGIRMIKRKIDGRECVCMGNALPVPGGKEFQKPSAFQERGDFPEYLEFLEKEEPDVIHVHSLMGLPLAFLEAAGHRGVAVVFTTHDYYGLCPKATLLRGAEDCMRNSGQDCGSCMKCPASPDALRRRQSLQHYRIRTMGLYRWMEYSKALLPLKRFLGKREKGGPRVERGEEQESFESLQSYYREMFAQVDWFHFNSAQARAVYQKYRGDAEGEVLHISNAGVRDRRRKRVYRGPLRIGYLSPAQDYKGFPLLKEVLDELYRENAGDFICDVYFNWKEEPVPYIRSHRPYREAEMDEVFGRMDVLLMPSLWRETFGMAALEALSYGTPVVMTDRAGVREILPEDQRMCIILPAGDREALHEALGHILEDHTILESMNEAICAWDHSFAFESHVEEMLERYQRIQKKVEGRRTRG